jgi:hypothetical protein
MGKWFVEKEGFEEVTVSLDHRRRPIRADATRPARDGRFDVSLIIKWL